MKFAHGKHYLRRNTKFYVISLMILLAIVTGSILSLKLTLRKNKVISESDQSTNIQVNKPFSDKELTQNDTYLNNSGTSAHASSEDLHQLSVILDVSGNGNNQTQSFNTSGDWTLTYTYNCSAFGQPGNFMAIINNKDGSINEDIGPNEQGLTGGNTNYYYDPGQHYLTIGTECSWHVTVKG